ARRVHKYHRVEKGQAVRFAAGILRVDPVEVRLQLRVPDLRVFSHLPEIAHRVRCGAMMETGGGSDHQDVLLGDRRRLAASAGHRSRWVSAAALRRSRLGGGHAKKKDGRDDRQQGSAYRHGAYYIIWTVGTLSRRCAIVSNHAYRRGACDLVRNGGLPACTKPVPAKSAYSGREKRRMETPFRRPDGNRLAHTRFRSLPGRALDRRGRVSSWSAGGKSGYRPDDGRELPQLRTELRMEDRARRQ